MKIAVTEFTYPECNYEQAVAQEAGFEFDVYQCKTDDEVVANCHDADGLLVQYYPFTDALMARLPNLKVIVRYGVGFDNVDIAAAAKRGIVVSNVPDYGIDEVSAHAVALLMSCARRITFYDRDTKDRDWLHDLPYTPRMAGRTLGIIGLGRIGSLVAKKMSGFDMRILAFDPYVEQGKGAEWGVTLCDWDTLLRESDYLSVNCLLNDETRHMLNADAFAKMKKTAVFVNTARGGVVNEADLIAALQNGEIAWAGLDVVEREPIARDNPLLSMDNVILSPHAAWYSEEAAAALQTMTAEEAVRVLQGQTPRSCVNGLAGVRK